tara:strand:+ start:281 stop:967 length:687 start_codon:yes stop_codon:yes gene_type:complete
MHPKILVGCPTSSSHKYALEQYAEALKALTYPNFDILIVDNSQDNTYFNKIKSLGLPVIKGPYYESARDRIIASRNLLRQKTIDENYDYFLSLEQDVLPPPDLLQNLLKYKKRVTTAIYFNYLNRANETRTLPVIWTRIDDKTRYVMQANELNTGLVKIAGSGLGCILIHKTILEKIKFRYEKRYPAFDDVYFFLDCKDKGINLYANTNIICKHLLKNRPWDWRNIKN